MISEQDLKLKLILGLPIETHQIKIHSVKVKDIAEFGYLRYNQALKIISADSFEIKKILDSKENISPFEFVVISVMSDVQIRILIEGLFSLIFREKTEFSEKKLCFIVGKHELNKDNFDEVVNIICKRNGATKNEKDLGKPSNEKARKILEKRAFARNKLKARPHKRRLKSKRIQDKIET